ncbi:hypothetical protein DT076_07650 [Desertihabitans brevis]|uniref:Endonuclease/exonuclease/phosphatase domain-containing protein n=1 Tax=Desertihabitans brevis TaxID=2268447 RepID=A0A367YVI3_9ACTN|nr:hypothetical protein [Desertihabitans brevis]RCK69896.1 hypothetical protein DT076_07650 [Desertihabitans brevis]
MDTDDTTPPGSSTSARLSRRTLLGTGAAGLALAGTSLLSPTAASAAARSRVRVATYNLNTGSATATRADLDVLSDRVALLGVNECMGVEREAIAAWVRARPNWRWHRPVSRGGETRFKGSNAVLWDRRVFRLRAQGARFGSRSHTPNFEIDERWITWVELTHRDSGRDIVWIQTHMDPTVERDGRPRKGAEARIEGNLTYMRRVKALAAAKSEGAEVLVAGDWNVDARADRRVGHHRFPFAVLEERDAPAKLPGLRTTYSHFRFDVPATSGPAKTGAYIDDLALWVRRSKAARVVRFTDHRVLTGLRSDHRPLVAGLVIDHAGAGRTS